VKRLADVYRKAGTRVRIQMRLIHIIAGMQIAAATKYSGVRPGLILNINSTGIKILVFDHLPDTGRYRAIAAIFRSAIRINWEKHIPVSTNGTVVLRCIPMIRCRA
jgi:hypothetical protein